MVGSTDLSVFVYWAEAAHNYSSRSTQYAVHTRSRYGVHMGDIESTLVDLIGVIPFLEDPNIADIS